MSDGRAALGLALAVTAAGCTFRTALPDAGDARGATEDVRGGDVALTADANGAPDAGETGLDAPTSDAPAADAPADARGDGGADSAPDVDESEGCVPAYRRCSAAGVREVCSLARLWVAMPCAANETCNAGACEPALFGACTAPGACPGTMPRCDTTYGGGSCTLRCTTPAACGAGATCVTELGQCFRECSLGGMECGRGERCHRLEDGRSVCLPSCGSAAPEVPACNEGTACERYSGRCLAAGAAPTGANNGEPCTTGAGCKSGECLTERDPEYGFPTGYLGGYCVSTARFTGTVRPGTPLPQGNCPDGSAGLPALNEAAAGDDATCRKTCTTSSECRAGYECHTRFFTGTMQPTNGVCAPIDCMAAPYNAQPNSGCPASHMCVRRMLPGSTATQGVCAARM